jgi:hypothetical protein
MSKIMFCNNIVFLNQMALRLCFSGQLCTLKIFRLLAGMLALSVLLAELLERTLYKVN